MFIAAEWGTGKTHALFNGFNKEIDIDKKLIKYLNYLPKEIPVLN